MITYVNSGNDAKRFNTFALAAKHSLIKKQQSINTQIDYLKSVYNSYVSHYNQLQKLIKEINDLTGESKYTKVDYSDFPAVDISASFSMKLSNIRLVPEGTSSLRFKNTIEDLKNNFSDLSLSIKSFYSRTMAEVSPYGSMRQKTNSIREGASSTTFAVSSNINTALIENDLSAEDWSNIKDLAERERDEKEKVLEKPEPTAPSNPTAPTAPTAPSTEDLERKAREEAEKAAKDAFDKKQDELAKAAKAAQNRADEADKTLNGFGKGFLSSEYVDNAPDGLTYEDPFTRETFHQGLDGSSYTDENGLKISVEYDLDTGKSIVKKGDEVVGTYDNEWDADAAADDIIGKDVFATDKGILNTAKETYEKSKEKAKKEKEKAQKAADEAAAAAAEHKKSDPSNNSSGGI